MNWILKLLGSKFDGYRTKAGGIGLILLGVVGYINIIWPDSVPLVPVLTVNEAWASVSAGLVAIGLGGKIDKNTKAVEVGNAIKEQTITSPPLSDEQRAALTQP